MDITPEKQIFGVGSSVLTDSTGDLVDSLRIVEPFNDESSYQVAVLITLLLYLLWVVRSISNVDMSNFRVTNPFSDSAPSGGLGESSRVGDVVLEWGLVTAMVALFVTRIVDVSQQFNPLCAEFASGVISLGVWHWLAMLCGGFAISMVWGWCVLHFMGYILRCEWIGRDVLLIKSRLLLNAVIWLLPILLMSTLELSEFFMTYIAATVTIFFIVIYLFRTFFLFRSQKISILHWILYLCSVEFMPITLMWVFFAEKISVT
ncbi:MAG: DUF4271 domain-containing protein [Rikenellaceae bacterium]